VVNNHVYAIEVPMAGSGALYEVCRTDTPAKAGELVRVLLSAGVSIPPAIRVVVYPAAPVGQIQEGQQ